MEEWIDEPMMITGTLVSTTIDCEELEVTSIELYERAAMFCFIPPEVRPDPSNWDYPGQWLDKGIYTLYTLQPTGVDVERLTKKGYDIFNYDDEEKYVRK